MLVTRGAKCIQEWADAERDCPHILFNYLGNGAEPMMMNAASDLALVS